MIKRRIDTAERTPPVITVIKRGNKIPPYDTIQRRIETAERTPTEITIIELEEDGKKNRNGTGNQNGTSSTTNYIQQQQRTRTGREIKTERVVQRND